MNVKELEYMHGKHMDIFNTMKIELENNYINSSQYIILTFQVYSLCTGLQSQIRLRSECFVSQSCPGVV